MWPDASARIASPGMMRAEPISMDAAVGVASHRYIAVKTKPRGTRMRRAIFAQLALATDTPQQLSCGSNHLVGPNLHHARIGLCAAGMRGRTDRAAQYDAASPERPIARRIRRPEDCDDGN